MSFLKRADIFISVICFTVILPACSAGTMGEKGRGGPDYTGNLDLTSLKYLEQIYSNEKGKKLYRRSLAGSLFLSEDNAVQNGVSESLNMDFFEKIDTLKSHSGKYWEDREFDLSRLSEKLESEISGEVFTGYIEGTSGTGNSDSAIKKSAAESNQSRALLESAAVGTELATLSALAGIYSAYEGYDQAEYIKDLNRTLRGIFNELDRIDKKNFQIKDDLRKIERNINNVKDNIYNMSVQLYGQDLKSAENRTNGFLVEISTIEGIDNTARLSMIKDFLLHGYEEMYIGAFQAALNVNSYINSTLSEDDKMPLSISLTDLSFMMELSFLRLSFAPLIFKGEDLLKYRANISKADLARVRVLKRSFARAYDKIANTEYRDVVLTMIAAWEITLMAHIEVVQDINDVVIVEMESADNFYLGYGTFGDEDNSYGHLLTKDDGLFIVDASAFNYGDSLTDIFDTGFSGLFGDGKYIRITENGRNIMDPAGLGLTPVCVNFSGGVFAPPKDKVFIDPVTGQFVLPRPAYWSRMESMENITSSEIREGKPYTEFTGTCTSETFPEGKFGSGYCLYNYDYSNDVDEIKRHSANRTIYPFGKGVKKNFNKGTISLWCKIKLNSLVKNYLASDNYAKSFIEISEMNSDLFHITIEQSANLFAPDIVFSTVVINNETILTSAKINEGIWTHLFIVWDGDRNLKGEKSILIFIDGNEIMSSSFELPDLSKFIMIVKLKGDTLARRTDVGIFQNLIKNGESYSYTQVDNIQIWNDVVTEDPNIFYNNGNGREDALHSIYGPENGYRPSNVGVGYHYVR